MRADQRGRRSARSPISHRSRRTPRRASSTPIRATCASCSSTARWRSSSGRRWSSRRCRNRTLTGTSWSATRPKARRRSAPMAAGTLSSTRSSQHKEAAWKFIQFLTREDVNGAVVDLCRPTSRRPRLPRANRKGADRIMDAAQERSTAAAVAALSRGLRHPGHARPGRLFRASDGARPAADRRACARDRRAEHSSDPAQLDRTCSGGRCPQARTGAATTRLTVIDASRAHRAQ